KGFVYCVASLGVTGSRTELGGSAKRLVEALRALTDTPLFVGVGISTPEQAGGAATVADGGGVGAGLGEPPLQGDRGESLRRASAFRAAVRPSGADRRSGEE